MKPRFLKTARRVLQDVITYTFLRKKNQNYTGHFDLPLRIANDDLKLSSISKLPYWNHNDFNLINKNASRSILCVKFIDVYILSLMKTILEMALTSIWTLREAHFYEKRKTF